MYAMRTCPNSASQHRHPGILFSRRSGASCRPKQRSFCVVRAASASQVASAKSDLLAAIESTRRGLNTSKEALAAIEDAVKRLEAQPAQPSSADLSAVWKLLWTTEKETLFILEKNWFGAKAGEVYQIIDSQQGYLQNVITFPPKSAFIVDSSIALAGDKRVNFQFTGATLQLPSRSFGLPPFGKGWFDNIYMDEDIRVSKDIRGDTLVTVRAGPAVRFSEMQQ